MDDSMAKRIEADPTALTTQQLWREIQNLKELLETRVDGIEKAIEVAHQDLVRVPTDVQKQVGNLKELHEEKFRSIQIQFEERDTRTDQTSRDSKVAVDAALQAAKELVSQQNTSNSLAIAKSEAAVTKQIDQMGTLIQQTVKAADEKVDDLKERVTRIEGMAVGTITAQTTQQAVQTTQQASSSHSASIVGIVVAALIGAAAIVVAVVLRA